LEGHARPLDRLDLSANYRLTRAEFRSGTFDGVDLSGKEVPLVPRQLLSVNAAWHVADARQLSATWRHVGEQRYDNDQVNTFGMMPFYDLVDLKYRHDLQRWSWSLAVDNLFYKHYYSYAIRNGAGTSFNAYPEPGRRMMLAAELRL
jgi:iron complex outermembrane receptor protein